jgi:hypothetical protein
MSDPVPAVTERDATGDIAGIFADIRGVLRVDVVNLIWRHLAVMPGALPWAWAMLRPLYADGTIAAEAARLHGDLDLPALPGLAEALDAAGLSGDDRVAIRNVLAAYDRTNAMALVALSALLARLDGGPPARPPDPRREPADAALPAAIPLPPLLDLGDMAPSTAALVHRLNRLGTRQQSPVLASMYRHLAHWPAYLALAWASLAPLDADGRLDAAIADAVARGRGRADRIAGRLQAPAVPAPAAEVMPVMRAALGTFTGDVIAKMVVICAILRTISGRA